MAELNREDKLRERRAEKQARKDAPQARARRRRAPLRRRGPGARRHREAVDLTPRL